MRRLATMSFQKFSAHNSDGLLASANLIWSDI